MILNSGCLETSRLKNVQTHDRCFWSPSHFVEFKRFPKTHLIVKIITQYKFNNNRYLVVEVTQLRPAWLCDRTRHACQKSLWYSVTGLKSYNITIVNLSCKRIKIQDKPQHRAVQPNIVVRHTYIQPDILKATQIRYTRATNDWMTRIRCIIIILCTIALQCLVPDVSISPHEYTLLICYKTQTLFYFIALMHSYISLSSIYYYTCIYFYLTASACCQPSGVLGRI